MSEFAITPKLKKCSVVGCDVLLKMKVFNNASFEEL